MKTTRCFHCKSFHKSALCNRHDTNAIQMNKSKEKVEPMYITNSVTDQKDPQEKTILLLRKEVSVINLEAPEIETQALVLFDQGFSESTKPAKNYRGRYKHRFIRR
ncbi:hypothetical protein LOAG_14215 [Loa loa]|uniref:Uncharacterized protein n=1 Tax=Loa loa TaxID=7209 RepID=A0A1S0TI90_LOALO|nr:hypothetical protein LOAG_14215 [Loa loa]EFO14306.1 hypothetical protein LOAG_14215 [Loa loa]